MNCARNLKVAGGRTLAGHCVRNLENWSLKDGLTSDGRLFIMFCTRGWVRATLRRSFLSWKVCIISRLAWRVLILGERSSATSWTDSYRGRRLNVWLMSLPKISILPNTQFDLEGGPVNDVVERSLLGKGDGVLSESHFNIIFSLSQVEPVQDGWQPGVGICRLATPGRCIKLGRFETGLRLLNGVGGVSSGGEVGVDDVICGLVTGLEVGVVIHEELQIGVQLEKE